MTIDLPPRRELPADVKERMRPAFTEARTRRNHTPLAVAAGVALLVAGGLTVTQSLTDRTPDPGRGRVVSPSSHDLNRCRAALNDADWSAADMVVFDGRKVLVGKDNRFCELSRSRSYFLLTGPPVQLEAGSITFRSDHITADIPPLGARTARVREANPGASRAFIDAVVTPDFFVAYSATPSAITEVVFDDRTTVLPPGAELPPAASVDSFESGDGNAWTPVNLLARCADNASAEGSKPDDLQGWQPLLINGLEHREGLLLAHRDNREWATCLFSSWTGGGTSLRQIHSIPTDPQGATMVDGHHSQGAFFLVARTNRTATTVEVSSGGGSPVTADVVDGFFIVRLPGGAQPPAPPNVHVTARNADKEIVYVGGVA